MLTTGAAWEGEEWSVMTKKHCLRLLASNVCDITSTVEPRSPGDHKKTFIFHCNSSYVILN